MVLDKTVKIKRTEFCNMENLRAQRNTYPVCHIAQRTAGSWRTGTLCRCGRIVECQLTTHFSHTTQSRPSSHCLPPANCPNGGRQLFSIERDFSALLAAVSSSGVCAVPFNLCRQVLGLLRVGAGRSGLHVRVFLVVRTLGAEGWAYFCRVRNV